MQLWLVKFWQLLNKTSVVSLLIVVSTISRENTVASAQVIQDNTLPINSNVTLNKNTFEITGGTTAQANLFHSFRQFSIPTGFRASFLSTPPAVRNIISRVTGGNLSTIDGTLESSSTANLFLINPSGIIFGPNAQLNVGGSFFASTAESLIFADRTTFSARNPQSQPLLTISVPVGLQFGSAPGSIANQSRVVNSNGQIAGLQVPTGKTLGLIGGKLVLAGGYVTAPQGQIELGSVTNHAFVGLTHLDSSVALNYDGVQNFEDIQLTGQATVNASGNGGGTVHLQGRTITLTDRSSIVNDTLANVDSGSIAIDAEKFQLDSGSFVAASTYGAGRGGNVMIRASDSINLIGNGFDAFQQIYILGSLAGIRTLKNRQNGIFAGTAGTGNAGNITLETSKLSLKAGSIVDNDTFGQGDGGNIFLRASGIKLSGSGLTSSSLGLTGRGAGSAGNITIAAEKLVLKDGGTISTSTITDGNGGDIYIRASDSVSLLAFPSNALAATSITSLSFGNPPSERVFGHNIGAAGNIRIDTQRLTVQDGAAIDTSTGSQLNPLGGQGGKLTINAADSIEITGASKNETTGVPGGSRNSLLGSRSFSTSPAGEVSIDTGMLLLREGGQITTATFNQGQGGTLTIRATKLIELKGTTEDGRPSTIASSSGSLFPVTAFPVQSTGAGGNLSLNTANLVVQDGASVAVNSAGLGNAGNLEIASDFIRLNNAGTITAATASGEGGNIKLDVGKILLLRRGSLISAEAGGSGNGGNITIHAGFVIAVPLENSDIEANAFAGRGGSITISTHGIFGMQYRPQSTLESDITASSRFGLSGIVTLNMPEVNPIRGIILLPNNFVDTAALIATSCIARRLNQSSFVVTGAGGLPTAPDDLASSPFYTYELLPVDTPLSSSRAQAMPQPLVDQELREPIVEVDGIYRLSNGEVMLGRSCW
jgi:filamentous hemagglutinin family protein